MQETMSSSVLVAVSAGLKTLARFATALSSIATTILRTDAAATEAHSPAPSLPSAMKLREHLQIEDVGHRAFLNVGPLPARR
jgi:hypothetical protein